MFTSNFYAVIDGDFRLDCQFKVVKNNIVRNLKLIHLKMINLVLKFASFDETPKTLAFCFPRKLSFPQTGTNKLDLTDLSICGWPNIFYNKHVSSFRVKS